jgi:hypothetical protein
MLKRAKSMPQKDALWYALGAKRFADLETIIIPVLECVLQYAFDTRDGNIAFLFSSFNHLSRSMLWKTVENMETPHMGDAIPWCKLPALFSNRRERICWAFAFCHMCEGHKATERCEAVSVDKGTGMTILMCYDCNLKYGSGRYVKNTVGGSIVASPRHFDTQSEMQSVAANIDAAETCIVTVARQRWLKGKWKIKDAPRAARRSIPFPEDGVRHVPKLVLTNGSVPKPVSVVRVTEICVSLRMFNSPQIDLMASVESKLLESLKRMSSAELVKRLLVRGVLRYELRLKLLNDLKLTYAFDNDNEPARRKQANPWHNPSRRCTHSHGDGSTRLWLRSCSLCNECDVTD